MLWIVPVAGLVAAVLSLLIVAYGPRAGYSLREPTEAETERLRRLRQGDGPAFAVRTTSGESVTSCDIVGLPGRRKLVVTDAALEQLDDDALRALVAVGDERARAGIEFLQAITTGIAIAIFAAGYVTDLGSFPTMVGAWGVVLAGIQLARYRYYGVDTTVGEDLGRERLRDALERSAGLRGDSQDSQGRWRALFEVEPSVRARMARLEE